MNNIATEMFPGRGFGPILFGMSVREVESIYGVSSEVRFDDDGGERTLALDYEGVSFFFHQSNDFRLSSILVEVDEGFSFLGYQLFGLSKDDILKLLRASLPAPAMDTMQEHRHEELEVVSLEVGAIWTTFYFDLAGKLQEVHWSVYVGEDDQVVWPTRESSQALRVPSSTPKAQVQGPRRKC